MARAASRSWIVGIVVGAVVGAAIVWIATWSRQDPGADALAIPSGYQDLASCTAPTDPIPVANLAEAAELQGCDAQGVQVVFPDGTVQAVDAVGVVHLVDLDEGEGVVRNWGVPGVAAFMRTVTGTQFWGPTTAVEHEIRAEAYTIDHPNP